MFESFSEPARHVIFFARWEAGRLAFDTIEAEHLVLGFIVEDQGASQQYFETAFGVEPAKTSKPDKPGQFFIDPQTAAALRSQLSLRGNRPDPQPDHGDMPLSRNAQQVLASAFAQADGGQVTPLHLLWGVLSNEANPAAPCLIEHGITIDRVEAAIRTL
jgi:ATP-dependent Clp protease ATP-binding subunit ClpC